MKYLKTTLLIIIPIIILNIILISLSYIDIYKLNLELSNIIICILSSSIGGYYIGSKCKNKAYLEGIKQGLILVVLFFLIHLLLRNKIDIKVITNYVLIILSTTLGSILGINKRIKD